MKSNLCRYQDRCSGCAWLGKPPEEQRQSKVSQLASLTSANFIQWVDCGESALRDRVDLTWEEGRLGLFELGERRILDLESCPMLSEPLEAWLQLYRERKPPIRKGSVRLRVSPTGGRGAWLDFANQDVKALFEEREYLQWLSQQAIVEIGQRRKRLEWADGQPKLRDAKLESWFETYDADGNPIPLYTTIAGFTQSGFKANRALVGEVLRQVKNAGEKRWLELFAGSGNFSLALAASGFIVTAIEMDAMALQGLMRSIEERSLPIEIVKKDLYRPSQLDGGAWLVDPPRSGLKNLIDTIAESKPKKLIYISCWSESFLADAQKLKALGYQMSDLSAVDQFVHTPHAEWVATFTSV